MDYATSTVNIQVDERWKRRIRTWEFTAGIWILVVGTSLHFVFEWSGDWRPIAVFVPVNESVWEHCKLAVWPGVWFSLVQYGLMKDRPSAFVTAKCLSLISMPAAIIGLFYAYTAVLGKHLLALDILIFVLSIITGQYISYALCIRPPMGTPWRLLALLGLMLLLAAFCVFSFVPPHAGLFEHAGTGAYGILE